MNNTENTPKHCHNCHLLPLCKQAQNMQAHVEPTDGFAWDSDLHCADCLPDWAEDAQPLNNGETDSPDHCCGCGVPLSCELTTNGVEHVKELLEGGGGCAQELWPVLFTDSLS